ncbi:MAG: SPOR domain-containing protein [Bdellovibrionales bacterium]|nr:SPOR domain-containing protein [Bdellovibrionales bacterium]
MLNDHGGSKTDGLIQLVMIFFVSLLSFSVGTYVGKQVSDSDHRRMQVEGEFTAANSSNDDEDSKEDHDSSSEEKLSEEDISSLTEEFVAKEKTETQSSEGNIAPEKQRDIASKSEDAATEKTGYKQYNSPHHVSDSTKTALVPTPSQTPTQHGETAKHNAPTKEVSDAPSAVAHRLADGKTPTPEIKETRQPLSILPSVAGNSIGKYTIQVAAYPDELGAKNHAAELKAKGWTAFYLPAEVQNKTWYRVSVGLFSTAKAAKEFRKELQNEAHITTAIVQKIVK